MDLGMIGTALGGAAFGAVAAGGLSAWWWGRKLASAERHIVKLDQLRQFSDQQGAQVRKQIEQLQAELTDLRIQATRARTREAHAAPPAPVFTTQEAEDMLLRDAPAATSAEPFANTQILPRKR